VIVGVAAIIVGATSLAASASSALPLAMVTVGAGALLAGNGFYKLQKCLHPHSETYQAVTAIASATPIDEEEERVQSGLDALA